MMNHLERQEATKDLESESPLKPLCVFLAY